MTVIEIRPHRWGWKAFEAPGVEPVFLNQQDAIDYATESRVLSLWRDSRSRFNRRGGTHHFHLLRRIGVCDVNALNTLTTVERVTD